MIRIHKVDIMAFLETRLNHIRADEVVKMKAIIMTVVALMFLTNMVCWI